MREQIAEIVHKLQTYSVHLPESMAEGFVDELENTIDEIEALFGWTKVEDELPTNKERVYRVYAEDSTDVPECHAYWSPLNQIWIEVLTAETLFGITHWQAIQRPEEG